MVDKLTQTNQAFKIQKSVRLIHHQKLWTQEHFSDNLHQLKLSSADLPQGQLCQLLNPCKLQFLSYIHGSVVPIHGFI